MKRRTVYLETMGCQMNVLDSELVLGQLRAKGYDPIDDMTRADVVLINTCSVRDHAEQKALSRLGALRKPKSVRDDMVVGVIGCMAERDPDGIFSKMSHVDLVCGPGELNKVPALIEDVQTHRRRAIALSQSLSRKSTPLERSLEYDSGRGARPVRAIRRAMRACSNPTSVCSAGVTSSARSASCRSRAARSAADHPRRLWMKLGYWRIAARRR